MTPTEAISFAAGIAESDDPAKVRDALAELVCVLIEVAHDDVSAGFIRRRPSMVKKLRLDDKGAI